MRRRHLLLLVLLGAVAPALAHAQEVTVMAAASLTDAMKELGQAWAARGNPAPRFSFGASSALARQIEQGAPADIFISADEALGRTTLQKQSTCCSEREPHQPARQQRWSSIAPADQRQWRRVALTQAGLTSRIGSGRMAVIAVGDPASVSPPASTRRQALTKLGLWDALAAADLAQGRLRPQPPSCSSERGEAPLGIVYSTDAASHEGRSHRGHLSRPDSHRRRSPIRSPSSNRGDPSRHFGPRRAPCSCS